LNVIKEACGNAAVSIAASTAIIVLVALYRGEAFKPPLTGSVLAPVLLVNSWCVHVIHLERYGAFVRESPAGRASQSKARHQKS
jgi:hypothetical protein